MPKWLKDLLNVPQCSYKWNTAPTHPIPGGHYDHICINQVDNPGDKCSGPHGCRNFECQETHD